MKAAFTIATANYLAQAKTVSDSFLTHNQGYQFFVFLLDRVEDRFEVSCLSPGLLIEVEQLAIPSLQDMVIRYSMFELSNALKPFVAEYLLKDENVDQLYYFDSDILIYSSIEYAEKLLLENNIIITAHFFSPVPLDGHTLSESDFLNAGIYNAGFFGLKRCEETYRFLNWWKERMKTQCLVSFSKGLFVDQIWLNLLPLLFKDVKIIEHLGYNLAYWNLHERVLNKVDNKYLINEKDPLVFFHFSGYDFNRPEIVSKYQDRYNFDLRPDIEPLFKEYHSQVIKNGLARFSELACYFDELKTSWLNKIRQEELEKESSRKKIVRFLKIVLRKALRIDVSFVRN
jgi:lipopolysaccharide biosynthesis glycosyltransferase